MYVLEIEGTLRALELTASFYFEMRMVCEKNRTRVKGNSKVNRNYFHLKSNIIFFYAKTKLIFSLQRGNYEKNI